MEKKRTEDLVALLAETALFSGLPDREIRRAVEDPRCTREHFSGGTVIYGPRRFRRSLGILLSGRAKVTKGPLVVSELNPGALFGAAALFHDRPDYESRITARGGCTVCFFPQGQVEQLLEESPLLRANYIRYLSDRIHFLSQKIEALTLPDPAGKLMRYLEDSGGQVDCSAVELAGRLDVSRASLYRAFEQLEADGAILREGKRIAVISPGQLPEKRTI